MSSKWAMFCEASSIRGMQKITKARSVFSRSLWTVFVVVMTLVLVITSGFLVRDYLNYDTAWHTSTEFDNKPQFPSFTLCSHNPFGTAAKAAWSSGSVMTPLEFQGLLKRVSVESVRQNIPDLRLMFGYDNIGAYYQHLSYNDTLAISHNESSLFFCVVSSSGYQIIAENCVFDHSVNVNVSVKLYSHSEYFNCFTIDSYSSEEYESFIVVMSLVPTQDIGQLNHSFLYDVLNKGEGVKVTLHERGVMPDFAQNGFNVEPGRMNEVNYATTAWEKLRTPKQECRDNQPPIRHLNKDYVADYHQCANAQLQRYLLDTCNCLNSLWPVVQVPSKSAPYCIDMSNQTDLNVLTGRLRCTMNLLVTEKELKKNLSVSVCFPRCKYFTYDSTLSITKWIPSPSKLEALVDQNKVSQEADNELFLTTIRKNISDYNSQTYNSLLAQQNAYTYIKIKRKNWDVTKKVEKLTLDINILLSRIGGLCSLCIGLTAAFAVELLEFAYLNCQRSSSSSPTSSGAAASSNKEAATQRDLAADGEEALAMEQASLLQQDGGPAADPWEKALCSDFGTQGSRSVKQRMVPA